MCMRKIILVSALSLSLASCGMPGATSSDYSSLYNANIKAEIAKFQETYENLYGK